MHAPSSRGKRQARLQERTLTLSQAVVEVEWRDVRRTGSTRRSVGASNVSKSHRRREVFFDVLSKCSAGSRQDGRSAVEMAIVADSLPNAGASIRLVPRPEMPADALTKPELAKTNGRLEHLIKTGHFTLVLLQATMKQRSEQPRPKLRSRSAAEQTRNETSRPQKEAADDSLDLCGSCCVRGIKREVLTENAPSLNTAPRRSVAQWKLLLADDDAFEPIGQLSTFQCVPNESKKRTLRDYAEERWATKERPSNKPNQLKTNMFVPFPLRAAALWRIRRNGIDS